MKLIIFDCDGTLIESEALANRFEVEALCQRGCQITSEEYAEIATGREGAAIIASLKEKFNFDLTPHFWKEIRHAQRKLFEKELQSVSGIDAALKAIQLPMCIASNSNLERLHFTLRITQLLSYFEGRIFSADCVARGKPHPDVFLYAADQMKTYPAQCLVVEDSLVGVQAGIAAGMTVLAFCGGKHITERTKNKLQTSGAHHIFSSMHELPELIQRFL